MAIKQSIIPCQKRPIPQSNFYDLLKINDHASSQASHASYEVAAYSSAQIYTSNNNLPIVTAKKIISEI